MAFIREQPPRVRLLCALYAKPLKGEDRLNILCTLTEEEALYAVERFIDKDHGLVEFICEFLNPETRAWVYVVHPTDTLREDFIALAKNAPERLVESVIKRADIIAENLSDKGEVYDLIAQYLPAPAILTLIRAFVEQERTATPDLLARLGRVLVDAGASDLLYRIWKSAGGSELPLQELAVDEAVRRYLLAFRALSPHFSSLDWLPSLRLEASDEVDDAFSVLAKVIDSDAPLSLHTQVKAIRHASTLTILEFLQQKLPSPITRALCNLCLGRRVDIPSSDRATVDIFDIFAFSEFLSINPDFVSKAIGLDERLALFKSWRQLAPLLGDMNAPQVALVRRWLNKHATPDEVYACIKEVGELPFAGQVYSALVDDDVGLAALLDDDEKSAEASSSLDLCRTVAYDAYLVALSRAPAEARTWWEPRGASRVIAAARDLYIQGYTHQMPLDLLSSLCKEADSMAAYYAVATAQDISVTDIKKFAGLALHVLARMVPEEAQVNIVDILSPEEGAAFNRFCLMDKEFKLSAFLAAPIPFELCQPLFLSLSVLWELPDEPDEEEYIPLSR